MVPVNFISRGVSNFTILRMPEHFSFMDTKEQTKVTNVETLAMIFLREGGEVPGLKPMGTKLDRFNSFDLGLVDECSHLFFTHTQVFIVV